MFLFITFLVLFAEEERKSISTLLYEHNYSLLILTICYIQTIK